MSSRFICIHGHFYQPARENPWLDTVEIQDAAAPYHDWNDRVTAECYARNAASRILDDQQRIVRIVNNYAKISFSAGSTLLRWLARHHHDVYLQILEADAQSRRAYYGHGNAIAQIYNHLIMPLASARDKLTQIRWGLRDFERRFRRRPEGMWLSELAVDLETLELLASHHIGFTILAPHQAHRVRALADGAWTEVTEATLDITVPYRCRLPSGRSMSIFFYDGPISRAIAFEGLLSDGGALATRLIERAASTAGPPRLVLVATDGESYGHHHRFGEMALTSALDRIAESEISLTNLGAYLAAHPPVHEVEIHENTSWSCPHGIERWRSDCGCNTGKGYHQRWRGPLREAITWLKDELDRVFEREGAALFTDPWATRDEAVDIADRETGAVDAFLGRHLTGTQSASRRTTALKLLEMQRQAMLMQSSDGWFFDEISGPETVQILAHAERAIELAGGFGASVEDGFVDILKRAQGNLTQFPTGAAVYNALVKPMTVSTDRLVAHYAIGSLLPSQKFAAANPPQFPSNPAPGVMTKSASGETVYATVLREQSRETASAGPHTLITGRVLIQSLITEEVHEAAYALLHFSGHEVHCAVRIGWSARDYEPVRDDLHARFGREILSEIVRRLDDAFGPSYYTLQDLLLEDRRRVLAAMTARTLTEVEDAYRKLFEAHRPLMQYLREAQADIPAPMLVAAVFVLTRDLERTLARPIEEPIDPASFSLVQELRSWGREVRAERFEPLLRRRLEAALTGTGAPRDQLQRAEQVLDLADAAELVLNLWEAQNRFAQLAKTVPPSALAALQRLGDRLHFNMDKILSEVRAG